MDAARQLGRYTIDDIYNLPDGQRAELIDGELYMMATPNRIHQRLVMELFLNADDKLYFEPDISVICDKDKLTDEGCKGAPDWIIEIVSPSSRQMDYNKKLFKYGTAGIREYWIVDPMKQAIMVYNFEHDMFEEYSFYDKVKVGIYEGFEIDFAGIRME